MLDFVYYPVSAVLWLWHSAFSALIPPSSALPWVLAVVFLVITLRALLVVPFMKQARLQLTMQSLQPQIAAIQKRHRTDRRRQAAEIQKLHHEHGVNVLLGLLPMLAQTLVFIGLFHVLRSFDRTQATLGLPFLGRTTPMNAEQNLHTPNYVFSAEQVQSFLGTRLFGAPLVACIHTANGHIGAVAMVAVPLMIIAAVATHFTARASFARQPNTATSTTVVRAMSLWIFPGSALVSGAFLPLAILIYWVTNNAWTLAQQHVVYGMLERQDELATLRAQQQQIALAPKPGSRPRHRPAKNLRRRKHPNPSARRSSR